MAITSFRLRLPWLAFLLVAILCLFVAPVQASYGDRLPEFQECVQVCRRNNCDSKKNPTKIPLHRQFLLWTCPQECDYACQHIITDHRVAHGEFITQFHGKWPFNRIMGMQEPFSVFFSLCNLAAHQSGLAKVKRQIPETYSLRPFYVLFGWFGTATWVFSAIFHTRDFVFTEQLDYFAAGASVLYGLYYATVRVFRLDRSTRLLGYWTFLCLSLYAAHVTYLKFWRWDYSYNMTANVIIGALHNLVWWGFSISRFYKTGAWWTLSPGFIVTWISAAMSLELLDFPPLAGALDAHSLWHLGTIAPCYMWYMFFVRDFEDDMTKPKPLKTKA